MKALKAEPTLWLHKGEAETAPTAFSLPSTRDRSQSSLMTSGCTECWGIWHPWPGRGFSVLNTHLLLSPGMESVNSEHWLLAFVRMLLLFTEVSKLFWKESFLLVSNSDFHWTTEKKTRSSLLKEIAQFYPPTEVLNETATRLSGRRVSRKGFCGLQLVIFGYQNNIRLEKIFINLRINSVLNLCLYLIFYDHKSNHILIYL